MKQLVRQKILKIRGEISPQDKQNLDVRISDLIMRSEFITRALVVGCYCSMVSEVDTKQILLRLLDSGKEVYLPVIVDASNKLMEFVKLETLGDLESGIYSEEPKDKSKVLVKEMEVALIPLLAFDRRGNRLGFGFGYYDRYLQGKHVLKVGIAYSHQESLEELPHETHDIPLDYVITEKEVIKCKR